MKNIITQTTAVLLLTGLSLGAHASDNITHLNSGKILPTNLPFSELVV